MKILLIQPKMHRRPMDTGLKTRMSPSLALLTLVSLTPECHGVTMINENAEDIDFDISCDFVGITVTLDVFDGAAAIAARFRSRGISVVAGGVHVTSCPSSCADAFDAICVGPAERVWQGILDDAEKGRLKKIYDGTGGFSGKDIVSPAYGFDGLKKYLFTNVVLTGRGCPNRCSFCYNSCENHLFVRRPIKDVLGDAAAVKTRHVLFVDDNFAGDREYALALSRSLKELKIKWGAAAASGIAYDAELLDAMADSGCRTLFVGLESLDAKVLSGMGKSGNRERYERLVRELYSRGIMLNASMVFGSDGEDESVFDTTLEWLIENRVSTLTAHILTPYPGTEYYARLLREGRITDSSLSHYNTAHVVFEPRGMSAEALEKGYLRIYREFYSFSSIIKRLPKQKSLIPPYLMFNLFYRKFGKFTSALSSVIPMRVIGRAAAFLAYFVR